MKRLLLASTAILTFFLSALLLIFILFWLGIFSKDKIVVTTFATTAPHLKVVLGQFKLKMQMPDTIKDSDVNGVWVTEKGLNEIDEFLDKNWLAFGDYFVLTETLVGVGQESTTSPYNPLIEVSDWYYISGADLWALIIIDIILLLLFWLLYRQFKKIKT